MSLAPPTTYLDRYDLSWTAAQLRALARTAAAAHGIPPGGFVALLQAESGFDPNAQSPAGAQGIAQFMPPTSAEWGVDPWDPPDAIRGAARYLAWIRARVVDWPAALAAYNWGIGNVTRATHDGVFDLAAAPQETRIYVQLLAPLFPAGPGAPAPSAPGAGTGAGALLLAIGVAWVLFS